MTDANQNTPTPEADTSQDADRTKTGATSNEAGKKQEGPATGGEGSAGAGGPGGFGTGS